MDDTDPGELLGVRETARLLDVHENTVRNWEAAGILTAVRLPAGARSRRFSAADVDHLKELRDSGQQDQARRAVLEWHELDDLVTVARMYLDVFAVGPPQGALYQNVDSIVRRYGKEAS